MDSILRKLDKNLDKVLLIAEIYKDMPKAKIATEEELTVARMKGKVAKDEMVGILFENHKMITECIEKEEWKGC